MDNPEETSTGAPTLLPPAEAFGRAQRSPWATIRMVLAALLGSVAVWVVSFIALATPVRIFPDPGAVSKYTETLKHLVHGSASADEELITLSLLTVWSIIWGCFLAALTAPARRPELLRLTSACALFCLVSWLVGVLFFAAHVSRADRGVVSRPLSRRRHRRDLLLAGSAVAPNGRPVPRMICQVSRVDPTQAPPTRCGGCRSDFLLPVSLMSDITLPLWNAPETDVLPEFQLSFGHTLCQLNTLVQEPR